MPLPAKSRDGCNACKQQHIKCDESRPHCKNCLQRRIRCPGYTRQFIWKTKYERFNTNKSKTPASSSSASPSSDKQTSQSATSLVLRAAKNASNTRQQFTPRSSSSFSSSTTSSFSSSSDDPVPNTNPQHEKVKLSPANDRISVVALDRESDASSPTEIQRTTSWPSNDVVAPSPLDNKGFLPSKGDRLVGHYFEHVCGILACFDSTANPFRTTVNQTLHSCPYIYHCLAGIAATHMSCSFSELGTAALKHQTQAVQGLLVDVKSLRLAQPARRKNGGTVVPKVTISNYHALLGTILLGMTSSWSNASQIGEAHLKGARMLFQTWAIDNNLYTETGGITLLNQEQSFIVGAMAYWECLMSFIVDQPLDSATYLRPFCTPAEGQRFYPHPWTGVGSPIFIYLALFGILMRHNRTSHGTNQHKVLQDVRSIYEEVLAYRLPVKDSLESTQDSITPVEHLCRTVEIYRLVTMMEIVQSFPSVVMNNTNQIVGDPLSNWHQQELILDLAFSTLAIILSLPGTTGVMTLLCLPFISAGSALQTRFLQQPQSVPDDAAGWRHAPAAVEWWRDYIRGQIMHQYQYVGYLGPVQRASQLVQCVWDRADLQNSTPGAVTPAPFVYWVDIMVDEHLETLFG